MNDRDVVFAVIGCCECEWSWGVRWPWADVRTFILQGRCWWNRKHQKVYAARSEQQW